MMIKIKKLLHFTHAYISQEYQKINVDISTNYYSIIIGAYIEKNGMAKTNHITVTDKTSNLNKH